MTHGSIAPLFEVRKGVHRLTVDRTLIREIHSCRQFWSTTYIRYYIVIHSRYTASYSPCANAYKFSFLSLWHIPMPGQVEWQVRQGRPGCCPPCRFIRTAVVLILMDRIVGSAAICSHKTITILIIRFIGSWRVLTFIMIFLPKWYILPLYEETIYV